MKKAITVLVVLISLLYACKNDDDIQPDPEPIERKWSEVTVQGVHFSERQFHQAIVFKDKLWVIGGLEDKNGDPLKDVWSSIDGVNWTKETSNLNLSEMYSYEVIRFKDKLWTIGGDRSNNQNQIWSSTDGIIWVEETGTPAFDARSGHQVVVFNNKLWLIAGGRERKRTNNDVWSSTDGKNWIEETGNADFPSRTDFQSFVFKNKIWIIGGFGRIGVNGVTEPVFYNDVWSSTDGINWVEETSNAGFSVRYRHQTIFFDDKFWMIGGEGESEDFKNDVWSSIDGINWVEEKRAPFSKRGLHQSIIFQNKLWVIGGVNGKLNNDIWIYE